MPPELDTLLERFEAAAPDSIEAQRLHLAVRARLLDETVPETRIDRYVVRERLGVGGMGVVYAAHDGELDREVAIKLVRGGPGALRDGEQQRLLREARSLAQLSHPNVVAIYDVGIHRNRVFIAMELVRGKTIRRHVSSGVTPWQQIVHAYLQAGEGLAAAHAAGLVHRDFKPDNVLVGDDGRVRVLDFGLAQGHGASVSQGSNEGSTMLDPVLTATGKVAGTPAYMAPEQFAGALPDMRTDQFSFCVALWEALFGERPFAGATSSELRMAIVLGRISPPKHPERAPQWLRVVLQRGLAHDPEARWPSLRELLDVCARRPRWSLHWKLVLGVAATAALTAFGILAAVEHQRERACASASAEIESVWNDETAAAVGSAFEATGIPHAHATAEKVGAQLGTWREAWSATSLDACIAHDLDRTLDDVSWERRVACLAGHRERLATLVDVLLDPDHETAAYALRAAYDLPPNIGCQDDERLAHQAAALGSDVAPERVVQLRGKLARAEQLASTGRPREGRELAAAALGEAVDTGSSALEAETWFVLALADERLGEYALSASEAEHAYFLATPIGADEVALRAAITLVDIRGVRLAQFEAALAWSRHAEGLLVRIPENPPWYAAILGEYVGSVRRIRGEFEAARAAYEAAIAAHIAASGPDHPSVATAMVNLGGMLAERGDDAASALLERAEEIYVASYGEQAPALANVASARCTLEMSQGRYAAALLPCERALQIREAQLGPEHPHVAIALNNYANALLTAGDSARARQLLLRVLEIRRAKLGPEHPALAAPLSNLGLLAYYADDNDVAEAHLLEALEIRRKALPPGHVDIAVTLCNLADVYLARGQIDRALAAFDEAVQLTADVPLIENVYGRALTGRGMVRSLRGEREAAIADFESALLTRYSTTGDPVARCELRHALASALRKDSRAAARVRELARTAHAECVEAGPRGAELLGELALWGRVQTASSAQQ